MKKTALLAVALAACLGYVPARATEVVSSNVVGYHKITLTPGLNMLSSQFVEVGSANAPLGLTDATSMSGQPSFDNKGHAQTTIRFWNGGGYDYFNWSGALTTENPDMAEELEEELEIDPATLNNKWLNSTYQVSDEPLIIGEGFWLYAKEAGSITISGQVREETSVTNDLVPGLNMVSSPWPMDTPLTSITVTQQPSFDASGHAQTTIRIWNGGGYTYYNWSGNLTTENPDMAEELEEELEIDPATLNNHWLNSKYEVVTSDIKIGTGFWVYAKNSGKIIFER